MAVLLAPASSLSVKIMVGGIGVLAFMEISPRSLGKSSCTLKLIKTHKHTDCKLFSHMNSNRIWAANSNCLHIAKITNSQALSKMIKMCFLSRKLEYKSKCRRRCNLLHKIITQATPIKLTTEIQTEMCVDAMVNIKFHPCKTKTTWSGRPIHETKTTNSKCRLAKSIGSLRVMCAWRAGDLYGTDTFLI